MVGSVAPPLANATPPQPIRGGNFDRQSMFMMSSNEDQKYSHFDDRTESM